MLDAIINYQFMQYAVLASIFASIVCGLIGVIVVEKHLLMLSGGIAHTAYGGVGLGYLLGFEPIIGALGFSTVASLGIGAIKRKGGARLDVLVAMVWALGMALGIYFIGRAPGYPPDMSTYLFGNILSITTANMIMIASLTVVVALLLIIFFNYWKAYLFDAEFAQVIGIKATFLEYLLMVMVALSVVVLIKVAGIILLLALLSVPAAVAQIFTKTLKTRMILAILLGMLFCFFGLWISYAINISSGAMIIIFSVSVYVIIYLLRLVAHKIHHHRHKNTPRSSS